MVDLDELIAEARLCQAGYRANDVEVAELVGRLADALERSENKRAAVLRMYDEAVEARQERAKLVAVRDILNRDDFGDDWEHDEWVYRQAAERKLDDIEEALGSEVRHD